MPARRRGQAAFKTREALSQALFGSRRLLHEYQYEDLCRMYREPRSFVVNYEMGLGKTTIGWALVKMAMLWSKSDAPALILAPKSLLYNWQQEANAYALTKRQLKRLCIYHGPQRTVPPSGCLVVLSTYDTLRSDTSTDNGFLPSIPQFGVLIADEAHIVRSVRLVDQIGKADPAKTAAALCAVSERCRVRYALTGTPFVNREQDLMALARLLHPPAGAVALARTPLYARDAALQRWIDHNMIMRRKAELQLQLPPKTFVVSWLRMSDEESSAYELCVRDIHALLIEYGGDMRQCSGELLAKITRLRQLCVAPIVATAPSKVEAWFAGEIDDTGSLLDAVRHSTKLQSLVADAYRCLYAADPAQLVNMITNDRVPTARASAERIVIASESKVFLKLLYVVLGDDRVRKMLGVDRLAAPRVLLLSGDASTEQRAQILDAFSDDSIDVPIVLLATRPCGGVGLNLNRARYMLIADSWWNAAATEQLVDRVHRIGQDRDVYVLRYPMIGSIEEFLLTHETRKKFVSTRYIGTSAAHQLARMRFEAQQTRGSGSMLRDIVGFLRRQLSTPIIAPSAIETSRRRVCIVKE